MVLTSRAFMYEILGRDLLTEPMRVTMVRTVVTPSPTLAGAEFLSR